MEVGLFSHFKITNGCYIPRTTKLLAYKYIDIFNIKAIYFIYKNYFWKEMFYSIISCIMTAFWRTFDYISIQDRCIWLKQFKSLNLFFSFYRYYVWMLSIWSVSLLQDRRLVFVQNYAMFIRVFVVFNRVGLMKMQCFNFG